ncbi:hypothetical protein [Bradyrhizobium sp. ISRA463]|uniref:hypothetical protein n=1 Tax=Bradyrhizobium sp. ISRA463 TaxID=2866199 RepID=UPI0024783C5D|nr:hypothetical protein [Bradyrhizobium sp. ISRA463]WGS19642.1 hypothetical protein MTX22_35665 [Bradyrhizobium sp. ISRA463]
MARRILGTGCAALALAAWSLCESAHALDFFGLFGSDDPPPVSATTLSYRLVIEAKTEDGKEDSDAEQALRDASATYRLRQEPPPDGEGLVRRLQADINPLLDALWGLGRYNAEVGVAIDGAPVSPARRGWIRRRGAPGRHLSQSSNCSDQGHRAARSTVQAAHG